MTGHTSAVDLSSVPDTPALLVDLDVVDANIVRMADLARRLGVSLRPHSKTHKVPRLAQAQLAAGAVGVCVAKLGEAAAMVDGGVTSLLLAYPIVGEVKLRRLRQLTERADITTVVDGIQAAEALSAAFRARPIPVLLEIDTGMHRCGVQPGPAAVEMARRVGDLPGVRLEGIVTHEGHAYRGPGGVHAARVGRGAGELMVATAEAIRAAGVPLSIVSVGCSPTAGSAGGVPGITEIRPGTYVYNDRSQVLQGAARVEDCATRVVATVVSRPAPDRAIIDAGSKALALDRTLTEPIQRGFGWLGSHKGWVVEWLSEEHGVLVSDGPTDRLAIGERVEIVPNHICTVVNLFDEISVARGGRVTDRWIVAGRGRMA